MYRVVPITAVPYTGHLERAFNNVEAGLNAYERSMDRVFNNVEKGFTAIDRAGSVIDAQNALIHGFQNLTFTKAGDKPAAKPADKSAAKPDAKPASKSADKPAAKPDDDDDDDIDDDDDNDDGDDDDLLILNYMPIKDRAPLPLIQDRSGFSNIPIPDRAAPYSNRAPIIFLI